MSDFDSDFDGHFDGHFDGTPAPDGDDFSAMEAGVMFALMGHLTDQHARRTNEQIASTGEQITNAIEEAEHQRLVAEAAADTSDPIRDILEGKTDMSETTETKISSAESSISDEPAVKGDPWEELGKLAYSTPAPPSTPAVADGRHVTAHASDQPAVPQTSVPPQGPSAENKGEAQTDAPALAESEDGTENDTENGTESGTENSVKATPTDPASPDFPSSHPDRTVTGTDHGSVDDSPRPASNEPMTNAPTATTQQARGLQFNWSSFTGQDRMKEILDLHMQAAHNTQRPLPHILFASPMPGVGKTKMSKLVADLMRRPMKMLVPPFDFDTLIEAVTTCPENTIVFIDEIHRMPKKSAEDLLHLMEEGKVYTKQGELTTPGITLIGATTDADLLPSPVLERFVLKPRFEPYTVDDMVSITTNIMLDSGISYGNDEELEVFTDLAHAIAKACRATPRTARQYVRTCTAMYEASGHILPGVRELLRMLEVYPDGVTERHVDYLLALLRNERKINGRSVYRAGSDTMQAILRENKQGVDDLERYLMEKHLLERGPSGRELTEAGVKRAKIHQKVRASEGRV